MCITHTHTHICAHAHTHTCTHTYTHTHSMVLAELLKSELIYLNSLEMLVQVYVPSFANQHLPTFLQGRSSAIFANVEEMFLFQRWAINRTAVCQYGTRCCWQSCMQIVYAKLNLLEIWLFACYCMQVWMDWYFFCWFSTFYQIWYIFLTTPKLQILSLSFFPPSSPPSFFPSLLSFLPPSLPPSLFPFSLPSSLPSPHTHTHHLSSRKFYSELTQCETSAVGVCRCFIRSGPDFHCYVPYICNLANGVSVLSQYGGTFFEDLQRENRDGMSLMQHYTRWVEFNN